jgi:hypothetical protein
MKAAVLAALLALPASSQPYCQRDVVFSAAGQRPQEIKADALAIGWSIMFPYRDVTISVEVDSKVDDYSLVTAYLVTRIGPSTHPTAEIARTAYELPPSFDGSWVLFEGLDLLPGEYWIVFERPPHAERGEAKWRVATLTGFSFSYGTQLLGTRSYSYVNHRTDYLPAAHYGETSTLQGYPISVRGIPF